MSQDPVIDLINREQIRQTQKIGLIPSENNTSPEVSRVLNSCLSNKYSEGYPGRRYYEGNQIIDEIEVMAQKRVKELFGVPYVNVQPYSGSPANLAIYMALMQPGDTLMGLQLAAGGHLTHGHPKVTASGSFYKSVQYGVGEDAKVDFDALKILAKKHQPKVIVVGNTAYPFIMEFDKFRQVADEVGAWLVADISHVTGLVISGDHPSPVADADVIMSTTHKTFRGPRGAMIMVTQRGLQRDADLGKKIDAAIIPGLQGGPHNATTAAIAIAAGEAAQPEFKSYGHQIRKNADALAQALQNAGLKLVGNGTQTHLMVIDLTPFGSGLGLQVAYALDAAGIYANRNTVPSEPSSPFYPSGLRVGTPLVTTRGMKEPEMRQIGAWIGRVVELVKDQTLPVGKTERNQFIREFRVWADQNSALGEIKLEVRELAGKFPLFSWH